MPDPGPDYSGHERILWRQNARDVVARLERNDPHLAKRIDTYIWRFGYPREKIENRIRTDPMFAAHFTMEPRRQGIHEKLAAEWLRAQASVKDFVTLPKSGKNAIYISSDGDIRRGDEIDRPPSKSVDFRWRTGGATMYAAHKYTREGGGNQYSQYYEMISLLNNFYRCARKDVALFVIVDGPFFTTARMDELRSRTRAHSPRSHAVPIQKVRGALWEYVAS